MTINGIRIEGEGFALRPWRMDDCPSLVRHADNARIAANMRDRFPHPYTLLHAQRFTAMAAEKFSDSLFAVEIDGRAAGGVGFVPGTDIERLSAEIGYWLGEEHWGRGIMSRAVGAVCEHVFASTEIIRLYATVFEYNTPSMRVLEKAGFGRLCTLRRAAIKQGRIIDLEYFERLK